MACAVYRNDVVIMAKAGNGTILHVDDWVACIIRFRWLFAMHLDALRMWAIIYYYRYATRHFIPWRT